jgi:hypothetical protein
VAFDPVVNLAASTVATAPSPATSGTSLTLAVGTGANFPATSGGAYDITIGPAAALWTKANSEILRVTNLTGDVMTVTRATRGTTARTIIVGDVVVATVTADILTAMQAALVPGGTDGQVQYNSAGAHAGAANALIEAGTLRLPAIATPAAPAAGGVKLFGRDVGGRILPAIVGPSGLDTSLQPLLARNKVAWATPIGGTATLSAQGIALTATGTATAAAVAVTNLHTSMQRLDYLVTVAATTAVAGFRGSANTFWRGNAAGLGGFMFVCRFSPATGGTVATSRCFVGLSISTAAPTDVEPATLANLVGCGFGAADAQWQLYHADATNVAVPCGASFPVPTTDRPGVWELVMFCPPNGSSIQITLNDLVSGATFTGTYSTNIPNNASHIMSPRGYFSVGGTSSVVGFTLFSLYIESDS